MMAAGVTVGVLFDGSGGEHVLKQFAGNLVAIGKVPGVVGPELGRRLCRDHVEARRK